MASREACQEMERIVNRHTLGRRAYSWNGKENQWSLGMESAPLYSNRTITLSILSLGSKAGEYISLVLPSIIKNPALLLTPTAFPPLFFILFQHRYMLCESEHSLYTPSHFISPPYFFGHDATHGLRYKALVSCALCACVVFVL